jgi:PKD repeat protein
LKILTPARQYCRRLLILSIIIFCTQLSFGQVAGFTANGQAIAEGDTLRICRTSTVNYLSAATGFTTISWKFHLGTPATSNIVTPPAIVYNTNGIDSTIQVISDGVTNDTFFIIVKVTDVKPVVDFTNTNNVCSGTSIQFNSTVSSGTPPYTYSWLFGDGGTSTAANPTHTFTSLGCGNFNFNNTLTVTDATGCASTTVSHGLNILQAPDLELQDPDIISPFSNCENSPTPGNPNFPLTVNNVSPSSACITSYTIDWGDGNVQAGLTNASFPLVHTYTQIGSFTLTVTAFGANGCNSTKTYAVTNQTNPAGSLGTLGSTFNLCAPAIVPFTISNWQLNSAGTVYVLNFGDGTQIIKTHPLNAAGTIDTIYHTYNLASCPLLSYTALLNISNGCGTTPYTAGGIQVRIKPTAAFTVAPNPACIGQSVCFTNTSLPGSGANCSTTAGYVWDFGDGSPTSTLMNPCHTYAAAGTYTVTLTGNNFCGSSTTTRQVCITGPPTPAFTLDNINGCIPLAVIASNTSTDPAICGNATYLWTVTYAAGFCGTTASWNFTNGTNASSVNPSFVFNNPGTYTIALAVTNPCGVFTTNRTVIVKKPPTVAINPIPNACGTVTINPAAVVNACSPLAPTYVWTFQGGVPATATTLNPGTVIFTGAGVHAVSLAVTNECGTVTSNTQFTIDTVSTADAGPAQNLCGTSVSMAAVAAVIGTGTWTRISGPNIPTITTPNNPNTTITGMIAGTYVFRWTIVNGSCTSTSDVTIVIAAGPTTSVAGPAQNICLANVATLAANTPAIGTGIWTFVSGPNTPIITDPLLANTTVTGLIPGTYIFSWTITFSNCTPSSSNVQVIIADNPTASAAGIDQVICAATATLAGNIPAVGTGQWIYVNGPGGSVITNPLAANTTVTGLVPGTYNFRWSITNGACPPSNDTVQIVVSAFATVAAAGPDQNLCAATTATLAANTAIVGNGTWAYVSGPAGYTITNPALPNTTITGLVTGTYVFSWTIINSVCPPTSDNVQVTVYDDINNQIIAPVVTICSGQTVTINGAVPTGGTGTYTYSWEQSPNGVTGWVAVVPAATTISYTTTLTAPTYFRRRVTSLPCDKFSNVIFIDVQPGVNNNSIAANQSICTGTAAAIITGSTPTGGNNIFGYQWQDSTTASGAWNNIPGATNISYNPGVLTQTTFYRRIVNTALCNGPQANISLQVKITVNENSRAVYTATPLTGCTPFNLSTVINVSTFPDRNGLYTWYADGVLIGSNSTGIFPGFIMTTPGDTVIIKLVTSSQFGCKADSIERQFVTVATAIAQFNRTPANGCGPLTVLFNNTSNLTTGVQFFWNFGNGTTSLLAQPAPVTYNTSPFYKDSTYYITLKAYNGCDTTVWLDSVRVRADAKSRFGVDTTFGCSPFTAHIINTSLGGPATYYWDFGNGTADTTYTLSNFNVQYNVGVTDTFTIRLIAVNECKSDTSYVTLVVAPNDIDPQISIGGNQLFGCVPHTVIFNNATTGATNLVWNFGDGTPLLNTSAQQTTVPHTYTTAGIFPVTVQLLNGCSDTSINLQVQVFAKPIADFLTNGNTFCAGDTVRLTNLSQNANAWRWDFGDGTTSSLQNPTHVYATGGPYTINLNADKVIPQGIVCSDTRQRTVTVTSKPPANIAYNNAGLHCIPYTLNANALGLGNEIATWYITDTTVTPSVIIINGPNAQYTYLKPGTFSAKLVVVNSAGCRDSSVINFTVNNKPSSAFSPLSVSTCKNDTTILHLNNSTYTGIDPLQYRWLVNSLPVASTVNLNYRYQLGAFPLPHTFNTFLVTTNTVGCSDTAKGTVIMQQPPKALFNFANQNTCVPFILQLNNATSGTTSYRWFLNGVLFSTAATPAFPITQPATLYTVTLIADNNFGCKPDTLSLSFTTLPKPKALFTVVDSLSCTGTLNVAVNNQTTGATNYTWIWNDGSPNSNFFNPTHLYTALGNFPIILIAGDGTCRDTSTVNVKIANKPVVNFSANKIAECGPAIVSFTNLSTLATSYVWDFGDGSSSTLTNPVKLFLPRTTAYNIKLVATGTYGCKDSLVKPNYILAKPLPVPSFTVSPGNIIAIPNFTFNFINTTTQNNSYKYLWNFGDNGIPATTRNTLHRYQDTGKYLVKLAVFDSTSNCSDTAAQFVQVTGFPGYLYVPNAFQPGSLQPILKTFLPVGTGLATYRLQVFTTWGQKIFETISLDAKGAPNEGWNGLYNGKDMYNQGKPLQQDTYIWRIDAVFKNGTEWKGMSYPNQPGQKRTGTVTIVR